MDAREVIARKIRGQRKKLGLTQQQVAERGKLAMRSYQRYEQGTVMPRKPARDRLTTALELSTGALEPPAEDSNGDDTSMKDEMREVLTRLARIEGLLSPTAPDEAFADELERQAEPLLEPKPVPGTRSRAGRRDTTGR